MAKSPQMEELEKLLRQSILDQDGRHHVLQKMMEELVDRERALEGRFMKDETVYFPGRAPVPHKIAPHSAYHSASDASGRCAHCYVQGNQIFLGTLTVDGQERPTYHCTSCNKAYAELPASIKVIAEELVKGGAEKVGFTPATSAPNPGVPTQQFDYTLQNNTQQTNYKLDQVSSNISSLTCTIQDLMEQVRTLAEQNNKMMHQLATDPLISVRKAVSEFNLK